MKRFNIVLRAVIAFFLICIGGMNTYAFAETPNHAANLIGSADKEIQSILTAQFRKGPYLIYPGQLDRMQILWQLDSTATCTLEWGPDTTYSSGNVQTSEYGSDHQHSFTITGLDAATHYFYQVTVEGQVRTGSFHSAPSPSATRLSFLAYGDTRTYPARHNQVADEMLEAINQDSSFQTLVISVGDLVENGDTEADWDNQFFDPDYPDIQSMLSQLPYQSAIGNHEQTGALFVKYFPYPFVNRRYWSFDYGPAHFTVIDQYTSYIPGSAQLQWIQADLAATAKPWKFLVFHQPGWSAGNHANDLNVQNYIQPLCVQYGVSIVFAGHNHYYSRAVVSGIEHITTGGGGAPLLQPVPGFPNIVTTSMSYHFCKVEIDGRRLHFDSVDSSGALIDSFSLGPNCAYTPGDVNHSGGFNGLDVSYGVTYFKGGAVPPYSCECTPYQSWYVAGDANGSCTFNGLDISYMVAYLKGGPALVSCPDCPPL